MNMLGRVARRWTRRAGVLPIDPDALSDFDTRWRDPARVDALDREDPPQNAATLATRTPPEPFSPPPLLLPTSQDALYRNILQLTSTNPFSINSAVNYHFTYPKQYHSTRSFNLLISLALRRTAFGTAARLFHAMRSELVPPDLETWKLTVRWLVRTGRWAEAWTRVWAIIDNKAHKHEKHMPLPLWLEFFHSKKRRAFRRCCTSDLASSSALQHARYRALMSVFPPITSSDSSLLSPRSVLIITRAMIQVGRRDLAFSTTSSFLRTLPQRLPHRHRRAVLDLIHMHMATLPGKQGLSRHFAQRRILFTLLSAHRRLRPSPATLFLLLGSLRRCRRCGTLAMQCLRTFSNRWGPAVHSSMVRRRITALALKEGRLDIAQFNIQAERNARAVEAAWRSQRDVPWPRTFVRKPWRFIFTRRGTENRRWSLLIKKLARTKNPVGKIQP